MYHRLGFGNTFVKNILNILMMHMTRKYLKLIEN